MLDKVQFVREASPLRLQVGDKTVMLIPREFSSGSCGWFANGAVVLDDLPCQYTITVVVKNSKCTVSTPAATPAVVRVQQSTAVETVQEAPGRAMIVEDNVTPPALFAGQEGPSTGPYEELSGAKRKRGKR